MNAAPGDALFAIERDDYLRLRLSWYYLAPIVIHCLSLLAGRLFHAYGVSQIKENYNFRVFGMVLTFTAIISASVRLLFSYV